MLEFLKQFLKAEQQENSYVEPDGIYAKYFLEALKTTEELRLKTPKVNFQHERMITGDLLEKIPKHIERRIGRLEIKEVAGQCVAIHYRIKKPLEELFETQLYYTIGYVENQFDNRFYHTKQDILNLLRSGLTHPNLNIHTWLTLPSMEIIDFSLLSTYTFAKNKPDHYFDVIARHADDLVNGVRYRPTLVGEDFLRKIGAIRG